MKKLFLIDGAAGTGKTDLLEQISTKYSTAGRSFVLTKYTTRPHRANEKERKVTLDLEFVSQKEFKKLSESAEFYDYEYGGYRYGFWRESLEKALKQSENTFVIVRNFTLIKRLRLDFPNVRVVRVFVHSDGSYVVERLKADGYDDEAIAFRLERQNLVAEDYLRHPQIYDEILLNNSRKNDYHRLIDALVEKYSTEQADELWTSATQPQPLPNSLVGFKDRMVGRLNSTDYQKNVFLMMKFRPSNKLVADFIIEELKKRGYNGVRADQDEWNITNDVYNPIAVLLCCKFGIALFDEPEAGNDFSPNVAYELGMMHLQKKSCLILRHSSLPPMPFDLIKDLHRKYSKELEIRDHVATWLDQISSDG